MFKHISFLFIAIVFISGCSSKSKVWIDNPLQEPLTVKIGAESYTIPPNSGEYKEFANGEISFEGKSTSKDFSGKAQIDGEGLLNITGEKYVIWKDLYSNDVDRVNLPESVLKEDTVKMGDYTFVGEFQWFSPADAFIAKNWDLGIEEAFPDSVTLEIGKYKTLKKVFRMADFEEDYKKTNEVDPAAYLEEIYKDTMDSLAPADRKSLDSLIKALKKDQVK
jgi:hypothetical protein